MIHTIDSANFESTINENQIVLIDFFADWCGPCQMLHPTLEELANDFNGKAIISKVNVDANQELAAQFDVRSIPALFYFKNGKLVSRQNGLQSKTALTDQLNTLINN